jgi:hypothetical protein
MAASKESRNTAREKLRFEVFVGCNEGAEHVGKLISPQLIDSFPLDLSCVAYSGLCGARGGSYSFRCRKSEERP